MFKKIKKEYQLLTFFKFKHKKNFYSLLLHYIFKNINYEYFNKNKILLVEIIETNFNNYEQQNFFEKLQSIRAKMDNTIVNENIIKYKKEILKEQDEKKSISKNILLKIL